VERAQADYRTELTGAARAALTPAFGTPLPPSGRGATGRAMQYSPSTRVGPRPLSRTTRERG